MRYAVIGTLMLFVAAGPFAQTPPSSTARFEVASVKRSDPDATGSVISGPTPGRFRAENVTLDRIILYGFGLRDYQLVGGPNWIRSERFDLIGTYPNAEAQSRVPEMVQGALIDRFKLRTYKETREGPAYALVLARTDGRLGPKLRRSEVTCAAFMAARKAGVAVSRLGRATRTQTGIDTWSWGGPRD